MALHSSTHLDHSQGHAPVLAIRIPVRAVGLVLLGLCALMLVALASWSVDDPSFSYATDKAPENWLGFAGAATADIAFQLLGLAAPLMLLPPLVWGYKMVRKHVPQRMGLRIAAWMIGTGMATGGFSVFAVPQSWPLPLGLGGFIGTGFANLFISLIGQIPQGWTAVLYAALLLVPALTLCWFAAGVRADGTT
jgi:DNA segregation ATPase FtsK/SpoIIIE, S-DNA-T family